MRLWLASPLTVVGVVFLGALAFTACGDPSGAIRSASPSLAEEALAEEALAEARQRARYRAVAAIENDRGEPPQPLDAEQFEALLSYYCGACHGRRPGNTALTFETVEDLIELDRIVPGDSAASRIIIRIRAGQVPPPQANLPAVPEATARLLAEFIDALSPALEDD